MGLFDFIKKGEQKPVEPQKTGADSAGGFFKQGQQPGGAAQSSVPTTDTYTVKSGDSLSKIAKNFYGDAQQWPKIHDANKDQVKDPNKIQPGWILKIPKK
jgi:nucleoid-associated protein YgaU